MRVELRDWLCAVVRAIDGCCCMLGGTGGSSVSKTALQLLNHIAKGATRRALTWAHK
mgnify:CR=1 FL=1